MSRPISSREKGFLLLKAASYIAVGCIINNWVLEVIISKKANPWADKAAGGLLTFVQFSFVALASVPAVFTLIAPRDASAGSKLDDEHYKTKSGPTHDPYVFRCGRLALKRSKIPLKHYALQTVVFFAMSYLNNIAFYFHISQPLHMVFRSANLMTTFFVGFVFCGKKYRITEFLLVVAITLGAAISTFAEGLHGSFTSQTAGTSSNSTATIASTSQQAAGQPLSSTGFPSPCVGCANTANGEPAAMPSPLGDLAAEQQQLYMWMIGIGVLCTVLLLQSLLGLYQNKIAERFGREPQEALFYSHALALLPFVFTAGDLINKATTWSQTPDTEFVLREMFFSESSTGNRWVGMAAWVLLAPLRRLPIMWTYITINAISQLICVHGVYNLQPLVDALTLNVALTVRKCASLLLSIYIFGNAFTPMHWLGALLVFGGAAVYGWATSLPPPKAISPTHAARALAAVDGGASSNAETGNNLPYRHRRSEASEATIPPTFHSYRPKQI